MPSIVSRSTTFGAEPQDHAPPPPDGGGGWQRGEVTVQVARPVLQPPCGECGRTTEHAPECGGEPRPETLSQALARAQAQAIGQLRERVKRYLAEPLPRQGAQARGKLCSHCRDAPRYPDYRCAEHTAYLPEGGAAARVVDSDAPRYLELWGAFFARVGSILRT